MKIRTKLILLLSAALIVTMLLSTWLRIRWTQRRLEDQLKQSAQDTAVAIADELDKTLHSGMDEDGMSELLKDAERRHPGATNLKLTLFPDEETVTTFELGAGMVDAKVATKPLQTKPKTAPQR